MVNIVDFLDKWINFLFSTNDRKELTIDKQLISALGKFCLDQGVHFRPSLIPKIINGLRHSCKPLWSAGFIYYNTTEMQDEIRSKKFEFDGTITLQRE